LPKLLREHPHLQEFYGTVEWSSTAVFNHYLGWFSGKVTDVHRVAPKEMAGLVVRIAKNGENDVMEKANMAFKEANYKLALK
jgi:alkyl sulfatase BDS1-like metallo-beta-lactamase superfamily hydrolase